jgi:hypothetical protein
MVQAREDGMSRYASCCSPFDFGEFVSSRCRHPRAGGRQLHAPVPARLGIGREQVFNQTMLILVGMLVIGLISNLLVKPVAPKYS